MGHHIHIIAGLTVLAALAAAAPASAQEALNERPRARPPAVHGDGGAIAHPSQPDEPGGTVAPVPAPTPKPKGPEIDERSILRDLTRLEALARPFQTGAILSELSFPDDEPGSVVTRYEGLESVVVSRIQAYGRRLFYEDLRARWDKTTMTLFQYEARERRFQEALQDMSIGRWWERRFSASLVPERGGAPATPWVRTIGREIDVVSIGEASLNNEGRLRLGALRFYLDDDRIYRRLPARDEILALDKSRPSRDAQISRANATPTRVEPPGAHVPPDPRILDLSFGWTTADDAERELERLRLSSGRYGLARLGLAPRIPRGNLYTARSFNVSLRPTLGVRGSIDPKAILSSVSLDLRARFYTETRPQDPWCTFVIAAKAEPGRMAGQVTFGFELNRW